MPDELAVALAREADRRRLSVSELTREALAAHLGLSGDTPRELPFAALGSSGRHSTGRDFEDAFDAEWTRDRGR